MSDGTKVLITRKILWVMFFSWIKCKNNHMLNSFTLIQTLQTFYQFRERLFDSNSTDDLGQTSYKRIEFPDNAIQMHR